MPLLWLFFVILPILEIIVFFQVADEIGFFSTLGLCLLMAVIGVFLIQRQGLERFMKAQETLRAGRMPFAEMFHALCLSLAGLLFILPGFISDVIGFLLLIGPIRRAIRTFLSPRMKPAPADPSVIDGEYERVDPEPPGRLRP